MAAKRYSVNLGKFVILEVARSKKAGVIPISVELFNNKKFLAASSGRLKQRVSKELRDAYWITYSSAATLALHAAMPTVKRGVRGELPALGFRKTQSLTSKKTRTAEVEDFLGDITLRVQEAVKVRSYSWKYYEKLQGLVKKDKIGLDAFTGARSKIFLSVTGNMARGLAGANFDMKDAVSIRYPSGYKTVNKRGALLPKFKFQGGTAVEILRIDGVTLGIDESRVRVRGMGSQQRAVKKMILPGVFDGTTLWRGEGESRPSNSLLSKGGLTGGADAAVAAARWVQAMRHRPMANLIAVKIGQKLRPQFIKFVQRRFGSAAGRKVRLRG